MLGATFACCVCTPTPAAEPGPGPEAKARAALYQTETSSALVHGHWQVTTNQAGRLVATHLLPPDAPGNAPAGYMSLVITFVPKSRTDTECGINKVIYLYGNRTGSQFHKTFLGPFPQTNPIALRDVNDLLASARKHMLATHPEYAAPPSSR